MSTTQALAPGDIITSILESLPADYQDFCDQAHERFGSEDDERKGKEDRANGRAEAGEEPDEVDNGGEYDNEYNNGYPYPPRRSPLDLLRRKRWIGICAPMVRYSKLPFRELVRHYGVDIAYSPMILSDVFKHSQISRDVEYMTAPGTRRDDPVVVQFAASNALDLADAAELVAPYCNAVDLNCGCPQKWAIGEGIGARLMEEVELVADMVSQVKRRTSGVVMADPDLASDVNGAGEGRRQVKGSWMGGFPCSVKIRIHSDLKRTVDFARKMEAAGVDWIAVHGRTRRQKSHEPVDLEAIKLVKESVSVPVFANGNIFTRKDAEETVEKTGVDGVMSARGLLENPALFAGYDTTPLDAVEKFVRLGVGYGSTHFIFHHHLMFMLEKSMSRQERKAFNCLTSIPAIVDWLEEHYGLQFHSPYSSTVPPPPSAWL
ncbi:tRNA-dihydrouridine(20a/20b) synthase [NAD(P)+]-like protein [Quaeritorhiza haematococci]|nr:tRNA-dihydrouridine(20a/20b) synthase [NAD(P)+]-like protein [Quaeritorhiza haematococci]